MIDDDIVQAFLYYVRNGDASLVLRHLFSLQEELVTLYGVNPYVLEYGHERESYSELYFYIIVLQRVLFNKVRIPVADVKKNAILVFNYMFSVWG